MSATTRFHHNPRNLNADFLLDRSCSHLEFLFRCVPSSQWLCLMCDVAADTNFWFIILLWTRSRAVWNFFSLIPMVFFLGGMEMDFRMDLGEQMLQIFLFIICHKSSPIRIWHRHFCHLAQWFRPKCSSTSKRICPNVLVLFHMIITNRHRLLSKQCMAFKLERNDWKCNWKNQKMPRSLTKRCELCDGAEQRKLRAAKKKQQQTNTANGRRWKIE